MSDKTKLTEIMTGLGMLGSADFRDTLPARPAELRHVDDETWLGVVEGWSSTDLSAVADAAFANGTFFLDALDALRGRRPRIVEWVGPRRSPGDEVAPIDLRIDHVYLVSCKYLSSITVNASPAHVFDRLLTGGHGRRSVNWYSEVAPVEHQELWRQCRGHLDDGSLPESVTGLSKEQRRGIAKTLNFRSWPPDLRAAHESFCAAVANRSATRWRLVISEAGANTAEAMLWRLLRIGSAPYFVLGVHGSDALRLRVASPWDWRQQFRFRQLDVEALDRGQPTVGWRALVDEPGVGERLVEGHVEIRWSHGRFCGPPEAKVYLDTAFDEIPGYWPLR